MAHPALDTAKEKMDGALRSLNQQLDGIRTGKASPALVENITALYYGAPTRIRELGKAILAANIGVTPVSDGRKVRVPIPELSEERRKEMAKVAAKMAEDARIAVRNVRREANDEAKKLQKDGKLTEDDRDRLLEDIQKATDAAIGRIDAAAKAKEAEVMAV